MLFVFGSSKRGLYLASVVQKMDSAIHRINHYPADKYLGNRLRYPVDRDLCNGIALSILDERREGKQEISVLKNDRIRMDRAYALKGSFGSFDVFKSRLVTLSLRCGLVTRVLDKEVKNSI